MHFTIGLPVVWYFTYHILVDTGDSYEWVPYVFRNFEPPVGIGPTFQHYKCRVITFILRRLRLRENDSNVRDITSVHR